MCENAPVLAHLLLPVILSLFAPKSFCLKMLYLIGPDGLVNRRFVNFQKMVWTITVHVLRFRILNLGMHIVLIHAVFWKFAHPRFTGMQNISGFVTNSILMKDTSVWMSKSLVMKALTN